MRTTIATAAISGVIYISPVIDLVREFWKDFLGGFAAYWIHHISHKIWGGGLLLTLRKLLRKVR